MGKYEQDARLLLEYVGGKENIAAVSHCVSRMRFVLNDPAKADVAKIESLKSAKGTFTQAGQFQVIIGNTVNDFYNDFIAVSGIDGVSKDAVKSAAKQNQNALQRIMSVLAEIFAPLIPAIITGGLILGFRNCIDSIYLFGNGTQTLCDISLPLADRRGRFPHAAGLHLLVRYQKDGHHAEPWHRAGPDAGFRPAS